MAKRRGNSPEKLVNLTNGPGRLCMAMGLSRAQNLLDYHGTQVKPDRGDRSMFDLHCRELGIEHITASVRRPTMRGKNEVFHKDYRTEAQLFREHRSFIR